MEIEKVQDVLNKFLNNQDRAILIDGPWGVGKTYQILELLRGGKE